MRKTAPRAHTTKELLIKAQHDLTLALNATCDLNEGLRLCLDTALSISDMDCGGIYIVNENERTLELTVHHGLGKAFIEHSLRYDSETPQFRIALQARPIYCSYSELPIPKLHVRLREGLRCFAFIPVTYEGRVICCLNLASHTKDDIDESVRDVLETIAAQIANAIARLKTETALQQSENKYRELFELESDAIFLIDNQTNRILEANSAAAALYGYSQQELLTLKNIDLSAEPEDTQKITKTTPIVKDQLVRVPLRYHRKKDGTVFPVEITGRFFLRYGRPVHIAAIRDITERIRAEKILRDSEERWRTLMNNLQVGVTVRAPDTRIIVSNTFAQQLYGLTESQLAGKKADDPCWFFVREDGSRMPISECPVNQVIATKKSLRHFISGIYNPKTNNTTWILVNADPVFDKNGELSEIIVVSTDITKSKQAEQDLRERISFEQMIFEISNELFYHMDKTIDPFITKVLQRVVDFLHVDRGSIFKLSADGSDFNVIYTYAVPGFTPAIPVLSTKMFPWYVKALKKGNNLCYEDINKAPPQAEIEKKFCIKGGIQSVVTFPLRSGKKVIGALSFVSREKIQRLPHEFHDRLRLIGELLLNTILRKKAETELHRLFQYSMDMLCIKGFDGFFKEVNPAFEKTLGWSKEELLQKSFFDLIHPEDKQSTLKTAKKLRQGKKAFAVINRCRCKNGSYKWIMWNSTPLVEEGLIFAVAHDFTAQKQSEEALAAEKERLAVTLSSIGDAIISTDINERIVLMNSVAEKLTGWKLKEAEDKPLSDVFHILNLQTGEPCINSITQLETHRSSFTAENDVKLITSDKSERIITYSQALIKDTDNTTTGMVIVFRDITEKQKIEQNLLKTQKLESLGLLAGGIAHDFNNLLAGIFGYLDMAREHVRAGENLEADTLLGKALDVYDRAKGLTQQLLTFSKGGEPVKKTGDPGKTIVKTVKFALSGSNVKAEFTISENLWQCDFDESQISQAVDNIVINAKHAMPAGGLLKVSARNSVITKTTTLPLPPGKYVRISFKDQGKGITKQHLPKIFDPFFTTKKSGSGLGLTTCYSIIKKHDGHIEVESALKKGTTVTIYLPACTHKNHEQKLTLSTKNKKVAGSILVMDDEDYVRAVMESMLKNIGCTVVSTRNAEETIAAFKEAIEHREPFSAVILDLTIPGGAGGKQIVTKLLEMDAHAHIIASSGYSEDPVMSDPAKYGFSGRIGKPFRISELRSVLASVLHK
jgi:PAS domain S-box-containing protein